MNRIDHAFRQKKQYIGYLTAGDEETMSTIDAALALIRGGVTCLEIGIPFSDPMADGPVICRAMQRALRRRCGMAKSLENIRILRQRTHVPIVLFSYYNPILSYGSSFFHDAAEAGADGVLIVDLPVFERARVNNLMKSNDLYQIFLASPSTSISSLQEIIDSTQGFLYFVSRKAVTGTKQGFPEGFEQFIQEVVKRSKVPVVTGFGISNKEMAAKAASLCHGFVVGSCFVSAIEQGALAKELTEIAKQLKPENL